MAKKYDAVIGLPYTQNGEEKTKWQNVGAVVTTQNGGFMMLLDRTFNPAGMPNPENRTNIVINLFEPQQRDQQSNGRQQYQNASQGGSQPQGGGADPSDDIPFASVPDWAI